MWDVFHELPPFNAKTKIITVKPLSILNLTTTLHHIPRGVWVLSWANFCINIATIITFSFSPLFLTVVFGLSTFRVGLIEGIVEGTSWIMRIASGITSDYFRKRKVLILIGYTLIALARPLFAFAASVWWVFSGRMIDRIANGLQATPREALTADLSPQRLKGACYGLRQTMGTAGSVVGAVLGMVMMHYSGDNFRLVFAFAALPAAVAVGLIAFLVRDVPPSNLRVPGHKMSLRLDELSRFSRGFWILMVLAVVFMLGRFSEAFIVLWAQDLGLAVSFAPIVIVAMNLAMTLSSYPTGALSDHLDRRILMMLGLALFLLADLCLATATSTAQVVAGACLWGLQIGITQNIFLVMIADRAPADLRGTAFGIYYVVSGFAMVGASTLAGFLAQTYGKPSTFFISSLFGIGAFVLLVLGVRPVAKVH